MKERTIFHHITFALFAIVVILILVLLGNPDNRISDERKIVGIDIKGEVNAPGYYELEYGSRIKDAVIAAGSETNKADLSKINLALTLSDGEEIVIPSVDDKQEENDNLININTADMYKLCKLDGIGETIATNIINYRAEKGSFKSINELKRVKGVGSSKFNEIKDKITVK